MPDAIPVITGGGQLPAPGPTTGPSPERRRGLPRTGAQSGGVRAAGEEAGAAASTEADRPATETEAARNGVPATGSAAASGPAGGGGGAAGSAASGNAASGNGGPASGASVVAVGGGVLAGGPVPDELPEDGAPVQPRLGHESPPLPRRLRSRLSRLSPHRETPPSALDPVLRGLLTNHPKADIGPVQLAFQVADAAHAGQVRASGHPYITHPIAVASILADLGMDVPTLCAALLHDTLEETTLTGDAIREQFGDQVALIVDAVSRLQKVNAGEMAQAEMIRRMVIAMARDPRALVVKLSDRLHNMRTLRFLPEHRQERKARQTLEVYAPLAHRLGMNSLKWELEDLSFAALYPKRYDEIVRLVADRAPSRDVYLADVTAGVQSYLSEAGIPSVVVGRPKHYYSIYQKMVVRGRSFDDIYDLVGIRVLVDSVRDCYAALGTVHANWKPIPGRFKDYIAMPKYNMYQSLHTTVIGPEGKPVELQIRTHGMHNRAEYGIAAHWKYKEEGRAASRRRGGDEPDLASWLRQILDWQRESADPGEFLDSLRFEAPADEVFVFTPKGDVIPLPAGSTPIDFAYAVHTDVGNQCVGARINGRIVTLDTELDNGDTVEVFTSRAQGAGPSEDWLTFVRSSRARSKIRQWHARERREDAVVAGRDAIARSLRRHNLPLTRLMTGEGLLSLAKDLRYADVSALYAAVGENNISAQAVVNRLLTAMGSPEATEEDVADTALPIRPLRRSPGDPGVLVSGASDIWVKLARCCTPMPGDEITGLVTRGRGVSVHRTDCANVGDPASPAADRRVAVEWAPSSGSVFLVVIQVEAMDRAKLLSDVTRVLSHHHVNILSASVTTNRENVAISRFTFEMGDAKHLGQVLAAVRRIEGVYDCFRVTSGVQA
ncbi:bifunctional (p)ppGpp synthetase/guanosine-3',5'-bis(diphosphate) 3'-pyrophosphohydrolase [Pseudofrankia sp. BMG5.37]|uniref:RelA/SpoT family protein n=1 Tax=Pseudofrankia sp. BMG5.37 TaxID=3050035 RepID=UPI0028951C0F|nr:bifunctional (p)ppGpp synthetase/guanosine-3',5'-bis(diphosphate) 3'-pyrophosphohydrolase [Pseudofrankia sp. BMG5.37]MDT3445317.1 bifunctional (p)ppGpp synthetase/guanosine-3',5'-bis(diphosphate) 3'-pyrophosphohydrolase [Pseudofrankia sp. BMG5.37]